MEGVDVAVGLQEVDGEYMAESEAGRVYKLQFATGEATWWSFAVSAIADLAVASQLQIEYSMLE